MQNLRKFLSHCLIYFFRGSIQSKRNKAAMGVIKSKLLSILCYVVRGQITSDFIILLNQMSSQILCPEFPAQFVN